jgi:hypothetical protein
MLNHSFRDEYHQEQKKEARVMTEAIKVRSDSFVDGGLIPKEHTGEGAERSPHLSWDHVDGVRSWVLVADDPDAPEETYVHWVLFNLPGHKTDLPAGVSGDKDFFEGGCEGVNSSGGPGYIGPYPPSGAHRYYFKVYGLDSPAGKRHRPLPLPAGRVPFLKQSITIK